jgi:inner membrane protein
MPTVLSHTAVPLALGLGLGAARIPSRLLWAGAAAAVLPDADVLALRLGIRYADDLGHRGFSHSLAFALLLAALAWALAGRLQAGRKTAALFIFAAAASHGLLDMFTNGGLGVALFWPISTERLFFPWQVIQVSPLTLDRLLSARGAVVLMSELQWIWGPALLTLLALALARMRMRSTAL